MTFQELSIAAIRALIEDLPEVGDDTLEALARDSRSGVRALHAEILGRRARAHQLEEKQAGMLELERAYQARGLTKVAGVDEAGRGPLAGPVVAAAVIFPPDCDYPPARDSKQLDEKKREELYALILERASAVGIGRVEHDEIDRLNIHQASLKAMYLALQDLGGVAPDAVLIDGPMVLRLDCPQEAVIRGDSRCLSIAAASVVAKVTRDSIMRELDRVYPGYGFARHKGYPTEDHCRALRERGPCPIHRKSFHQVASLLNRMSETWAFYHEGLARAGSLHELESIGRDIRGLRDNLSPLELDSLRRRYKKSLLELQADSRK